MHEVCGDVYVVCINLNLYRYIFQSMICDWLWENPPVMHKDNYLEKRNSIIQSVISPEGLKLQPCNLQIAIDFKDSESCMLFYFITDPSIETEIVRKLDPVQLTDETLIVVLCEDL